MRRADRLFQLMLLLQEGKVRTASYLAEKLEVSERTVYRDISDLVGSGIPIDGEAGVGYLLRNDYQLPPLMFNADELKALALGARMVRAWSDRTLASTTTTAIRKIESILPEQLKKEIELNEIEVPGYMLSDQVSETLETIRVAVAEQTLLTIGYRSLKEERTERVIWPLVLYFWGNKWTLGAWCELRGAFRSFRVDLVETVTCGDVFDPGSDRNLAAYFEYQRQNESYGPPGS